MSRNNSIALAATLAAGFLVVPFVGNDYWFSAVLIPFLTLSLAGLGQNLLTGYAGQLSLGSAAFMAVGAYAAYNFNLRLPGLPLPVSFLLAGLSAAGVGVFFGLPSLRLRGFYLIVSTLAAQFFVEWAFSRFAWFSNHAPSGVISVPSIRVLGVDFASPPGRYVFTLAIVTILAISAWNLVRGETGRRFLAVRDREIAAAVMGVPVARTKLVAFAVSSFYLGIAGALWAFAYVGTVEPHGLDLNRSFQVLFIVIIGGLGSISGVFLGAAFLVFLPLAMDHAAARIVGGNVDPANLQNLQKVVFGVVIVLFLIKEPEGLARLIRVARERWRTRSSAVSA